MGTGAITGYIDVAQIVLYIFWVFFFGLVYYLQMESKREGFPLETVHPCGATEYSPGFVMSPTRSPLSAAKPSRWSTSMPLSTVVTMEQVSGQSWGQAPVTWWGSAGGAVEMEWLMGCMVKPAA